MLRSISEVSVLTGLSKVSIYKKIKQEKFQYFIIKNKGITYVSEDGVNLILKEIGVKRVNSESLKSLNCEQKFTNEEVATTIENKGIKVNEEWLKELKVDYINSLKSEINYLREQIGVSSRKCGFTTLSQYLYFSISRVNSIDTPLKTR